MDDWRLYAKAIVKYDPKFYNEGVYTKDEWTAISNIGKFFDGKELTMASYRSMENKYVEAATLFLSFFDSKNFHVRNHEVYSKTISQMEFDESLLTVEDGSKLPVSKSEDYIRLVLREFIWGELHTDNCSIHFGYDYYMYFVTKKDFSEIYPQILNLGLFVHE
ncbi:MAG: hypothetical protein AAFO69_14900 [Bacteroidota bacterium]